jgi:uncharacterized membrane protein
MSFFAPLRRFVRTLQGIGVLCCALQASKVLAQNPNFNTGDLVLYFQKPGDEDTIYVSLGSAALLYRGSEPGPSAAQQKLNIVNINAELTQAYGANWASDPGIYAGIAAARSSSTGTGIIDGDQTRTLYVGASRLSLGATGLPGSEVYDLTSSLPFTVSSGQIIGMNNILETRYSTRVAISPTSVSQIDDQNPFLAPGIQDTAFKGFAGGVQQVGRATPFGTFGPAGQVEFALDLYRIVPRDDSETAGVEVPGTKNVGTFEGTLVIGTNGAVSFITEQGVLAPEITVEQSFATETVEIKDGQTLDLGTALPGTPTPSIRLSIRNSGAAPLTGLALTTDGPHAADFSVTPLQVTTLDPERVAEFTITFTPGASGNRNAAIRIASNDTDENPYDILLSGTGIVVAPEISIRNAAGSSLVDGELASTQNFEDTLLGGSSSPRQFTIVNEGNAVLTGLAIRLAGSHPGDFEVSQPGSNTLQPGGTTTFTASFTPTSAGSRSATVLIASNDSDENPFELFLGGNGEPVKPEITVKHLGASLVGGSPNSKQDFGSVDAGFSGNPKYFIIRNSGTAGLTDIRLSLVGAHAKDFVVRRPSTTNLGPRASTIFSVVFRPRTPGSRKAVVRIHSNDASQSPFDIQVQGLATRPQPEIDVQQPPRSSLVSGTSKRNFGTVKLGTTKTRTFTILNKGKARLTGLDACACGGTVGDYTVDKPRKTSLNAGESTTFKVTFRPSGAGNRSSSVRVFSNDADEYPFEIKVSGSGSQP